MAEGGFSTSIKDGTDADFEYTCSPCGEGDIREQAVKYCPVCDEHLCISCTQHHGRLKSTRSHTLQNADASTNTPGVAVVTKCYCDRDRDIEMYCEQHDMVYCARCIAKEHRTCTGVLDLEDVIVSLKQKNELESLKTDTRNIHKRLEDTERKTQTNINSVKEQRNDVISQMEELERDLVEHIRKLKNKAMEALETEYTSVKEELESNISLVTEVKQKVKHASSQLQSVYSLDAKQQFIQSKLVQKAVNDASEVVDRCEDKGCQSLHFEESTEIKSSIMAMTSLGCIQKITEGKSQAKLALKIYQVTSKREVNIKMKGDSYNCFISGICQLPDGTIILADLLNSRLKRLDENYTIKDCFNVESSPRGICCTVNTEVAVKLYNNKVQFISIGSSFSKLRDISASYENNEGMAYFTGEFWLSNDRAVDVYDTSGELLKTIGKDANGQFIFKSTTNQIAVSGDTIIVTDNSDGAVCLRRDGTVKRELRDGRLKHTYGVCVSSDGTVFIAGYHSHNIVMFDRDGKCLRELVNKDSGLVNPISFLYDEKRSCLVVGCASDTIRIYNV